MGAGIVGGRSGQRCGARFLWRCAWHVRVWRRQPRRSRVLVVGFSRVPVVGASRGRPHLLLSVNTCLVTSLPLRCRTRSGVRTRTSSRGTRSRRMWSRSTPSRCMWSRSTPGRPMRSRSKLCPRLPRLRRLARRWCSDRVSLRSRPRRTHSCSVLRSCPGLMSFRSGKPSRSTTHCPRCRPMAETSSLLSVCRRSRPTGSRRAR
ncbi:hypothetical protein MLGJGCBP_04710 [Rhodococcus sp. T7]|nr:hypothetical protein MLGJGCBP_09272 [Rhodococcus sp. T7]KAF0962089.1 hypothetical protein MLGJGCBP_04710 [Rhodococcus sp. T7]